MIRRRGQELEILITQEDWDNCYGYENNLDCLLATALKRIFPSWQFIIVHECGFYLREKFWATTKYFILDLYDSNKIIESYGTKFEPFVVVGRRI